MTPEKRIHFAEQLSASMRNAIDRKLRNMDFDDLMELQSELIEAVHGNTLGKFLANTNMVDLHFVAELALARLQQFGLDQIGSNEVQQ